MDITVTADASRIPDWLWPLWAGLILPTALIAAFAVYAWWKGWLDARPTYRPIIGDRDLQAIAVEVDHQLVRATAHRKARTLLAVGQPARVYDYWLGDLTVPRGDVGTPEFDRLAWAYQARAARIADAYGQLAAGRRLVADAEQVLARAGGGA